MKLSTILFSLLLAPAAQALGREAIITVTNPTDLQRREVVEVNAAQLGDLAKAPFGLYNELNLPVDYQLTYDGKLIFEAGAKPHSSYRYTLRAGRPAPMTTYVCGRLYAERADDISWENDLTGCRLYGPGTQRAGERAYGIDLWGKRSPEPVLERIYHSELSHLPQIAQLRKEGRKAEADSLSRYTSYHLDHGLGLDLYSVGPSLGCGVPALVGDDGELRFPWCYTHYRILDNGPLRFTLSLEFEPFDLGADKGIVEHRLISLDKGTPFNRMEVWYEGLKHARQLAAGFVIHLGDTTSLTMGPNYLQYADPTDKPAANNFQVYVAALFPQGVDSTHLFVKPIPRNSIYGNAVGLWRLQPGAHAVYYFGSAWSEGPIRNQRQWQTVVDEFFDCRKAPLQVSVRIRP